MSLASPAVVSGTPSADTAPTDEMISRWVEIMLAPMDLTPDDLQHLEAPVRAYWDDNLFERRESPWKTRMYFHPYNFARHLDIETYQIDLADVTHYPTKLHGRFSRVFFTTLQRAEQDGTLASVVRQVKARSACKMLDDVYWQVQGMWPEERPAQNSIPANDA